MKSICVIGAGRWGKNHIRTLNSLNSLGGIVESSSQRLRELKTEYPKVQLFHNVKEALEYGFDGFVVATPAETHFSLGKYILEQKIPVLIEKPLALTEKDAQTLEQIAQTNSTNLMVGHVLLFHPAIKKIKTLIKEGKIGKLQYIYSNRLNLGTVRKEENVFWSFAPHDLSIFEYLIGSEPVSIHSSGGAFLQSDIHDTTMTTLEYPNNVKTHIFVSWLHPFKEHRMIVIGSKGMLSFEDSSKDKNILFYEKGIDWINGEPVKRDGATEIIEYEKSMPLTNELEYFINNLDKTIKIANGKSGLGVVKVLEKATKSLFGKQKVLDKETSKYSPNYKVHKSAYIDDNVEIGKNTKIWHFSHIQTGTTIGKNCSIGQNVNVGNNVKIGSSVKIQNNVSVYEGVELEDYVFCGPSMVFTNISEPRSKYPQQGAEFYLKTLVKEGASIGANATIVCGNTIGNHAFIGAGSTVVNDVPNYAMMVGNPARQIGWMCECGKKLTKNLKCSRCNKEYSEKNNILQEVK